MPTIEKAPTSTTIIVAGWIDPTNAYAFDNAFTYSETDTAEQEYNGYSALPNILQGVEVIDKVYARLKWKTLLTNDTIGDTATATCTLRVYDGSTWQNYQVTAKSYTCTTINDESFTDSEGDDTNTTVNIDVTAHINTLNKWNNAKTRLLFAVAETKQITLLLAGYVSCVAGDIGKTVTDDGASVGTLVSYDNVARTWVITTSATIATGSVMAIVTGTGAGTTTGAQTGTTVRWSMDAVSLIVCYHIVGGIPATAPRGLAVTKYTYSPKVQKAFQTVEQVLQTLSQT